LRVTLNSEEKLSQKLKSQELMITTTHQIKRSNGVSLGLNFSKEYLELTPSSVHDAVES
jgi:hypothetical protein